jgi:hypothetical protein
LIYSAIAPKISGATNAEKVIAVNLIPIPNPALFRPIHSDIKSILSGCDIPKPNPHNDMESR